MQQREVEQEEEGHWCLTVARRDSLRFRVETGQEGCHLSPLLVLLWLLLPCVCDDRSRPISGHCFCLACRTCTHQTHTGNHHTLPIHTRPSVGDGMGTRHTVCCIMLPLHLLCFSSPPLLSSSANIFHSSHGAHERLDQDLWRQLPRRARHPRTLKQPHTRRGQHHVTHCD